MSSRSHRAVPSAGGTSPRSSMQMKRRGGTSPVGRSRGGFKVIARKLVLCPRNRVPVFYFAGSKRAICSMLSAKVPANPADIPIPLGIIPIMLTAALSLAEKTEGGTPTIDATASGPRRRRNSLSTRLLSAFNLRSNSSLIAFRIRKDRSALSLSSFAPATAESV